ncbi:MAG: thiamine diphosphokinase [Emergencia sp.]
MSKALVITSYVEHIENISLNPDDFDAVICADAGLLIAEKLGISPTHLIGDYDSMDIPQKSGCDSSVFDGLIRLPMEKDMTDTEAALELAVSEGFDDLTVLGGLGGRFDHTMGNIGMLARFTPLTSSICLLDGQNRVSMLEPGAMTVHKGPYKYLGLIAYGGLCRGVSASGVKYPLNHFQLPNNTSLGVSNEILGEYAEISLEEGQLLVIQTMDLI